VHALIGENGAGKSTLIKVLTGVYQPDPGAVIEIEGTRVENMSALDAMRHGIIAIYQDFSLFPTLSVKENIAFSEQIEKRNRLADWRGMEKTARKALESLGVSIDLRARANTLSTARQQLVAIARALVYDAKLLVMDEPTSALSSGEVEALFKIVRTLRDRGMAIIFISHKLDELFHIADRMTVLRDGKLIGTAPTGEMNRQKLISMMVGREISEERLTGKGTGDVVLEVKNISKAGNYQNVSFKLHRGEVLGITGLVGAGRTETVLSLFGLNEPDSGEMFLEGRKILPSRRGGEEAGHRVRAGIPPDRRAGAAAGRGEQPDAAHPGRVHKPPGPRRLPQAPQAVPGADPEAWRKARVPAHAGAQVLRREPAEDRRRQMAGHQPEGADRGRADQRHRRRREIRNPQTVAQPRGFGHRGHHGFQRTARDLRDLRSNPRHAQGPRHRRIRRRDRHPGNADGARGARMRPRGSFEGRVRLV
jgi:ABC-type multidrug transport system ATPase subunit